MWKRLTEAEFQTALLKIQNVGDQTKEIAHAVLVEGRPQTEFVNMLGLSKAAVSRAVTRVWEQHLPQGYERVKAVLPAHQAFIVKKWAAEAQDKMESEK
jgi:hypothetical protein